MLTRTLLAFAVAIPFTLANAQERTKGASTPKKAAPAATAKAKIWRQEPESVLGIKIGVPLSESMPPCQVSQYGLSQAPPGGGMCWVKVGYMKNRYSVENYTPPGMPIWELHVETVEDRVEFVTFVFHHHDRLKMAELLKARYGEPTSEEAKTVQNRMGATFDSTMFEWEGANLYLLYQSRAGKIDQGAVTLSSRRWVDSKKFDTEKNKGKL